MRDTQMSKPMEMCMDPVINSCSMWLCRNAYPKPVQSDKFPGTEVFSIARADISGITGIPIKHLPYADTEIDPWFTPPTQPLIPVRAQQQPKVRTFDIQLDIDVTTLRFDLDGAVWPIWIDMRALCFQLPV